MFVLLKKLQRIKADAATGAPSRRTSLALRHVDAGSCNGCEHELTATANPFYDLSQYGLGIVASPRHADVLLVTGAITTRMQPALLAAHDAMPEPRLVAALGNCALGRNLLGQPDQLAGALEQILPVDLRIPGCPPTPSAIAAALIEAIQQRSRGR
jgi:Ni,Fe-hydrogenase III small subunit